MEVGKYHDVARKDVLWEWRGFVTERIHDERRIGTQEDDWKWRKKMKTGEDE